MDTDSSGSENENNVKQLLEAADTTLLNDSLFQKSRKELYKDLIESRGITKSQRYLPEEQKNAPNDIVIPNEVQKYMAKKLSESLAEKYEFCKIGDSVPSKWTKKPKNYLKLLRNVDCYVKPYEDFTMDLSGPSKRSAKQKRIFHQTICTAEVYKSLAVDGPYILNGSDTQHWSKKKERSNKVFHYKCDKNGALQLKETINEFTELRYRNQWDESNIRNFRLKKHKNKV